LHLDIDRPKIGRNVGCSSATSRDVAHQETMMALIDKTLGGILLGFGAGLLAQSKMGDATSSLRPLAKTLVKGSLLLVDQARTLAADALEQASDLVAEVQAERGSGHTSPKA
jgi:hypothetical protein